MFDKLTDLGVHTYDSIVEKFMDDKEEEIIFDDYEEGVLQDNFIFCNPNTGVYYLVKEQYLNCWSSGLRVFTGSCKDVFDAWDAMFLNRGE